MIFHQLVGRVVFRKNKSLLKDTSAKSKPAQVLFVGFEWLRLMIPSSENLISNELNF